MVTCTIDGVAVGYNTVLFSMLHIVNCSISDFSDLS
jgi:hypothetical protein